MFIFAALKMFHYGDLMGHIAFLSPVLPSQFLVKAIPVALVFPVMPFLCAWEIRKERPFVAWTIVVLQLLLYAILLLMFVI